MSSRNMVAVRPWRAADISGAACKGGDNKRVHILVSFGGIIQGTACGRPVYARADSEYPWLDPMPRAGAGVWGRDGALAWLRNGQACERCQKGIES